MRWTTRMLTVALVAVSLLLLGAGAAPAQTYVVSPPAVSYYYPAPVVSYYSAPVVYAPAPTVSYYYSAPVSYYTPTVSYYAPAVTYYTAPSAVTTTRYGLFGRPRVSTTYYPSYYYGR
jgi:hypothetical protein